MRYDEKSRAQNRRSKPILAVVVVHKRTQPLGVYVDRLRTDLDVIASERTCPMPPRRAPGTRRTRRERSRRLPVNSTEVPCPATGQECITEVAKHDSVILPCRKKNQAVSMWTVDVATMGRRISEAGPRVLNVEPQGTTYNPGSHTCLLQPAT